MLERDEVGHSFANRPNRALVLQVDFVQLAMIERERVGIQLEVLARLFVLAAMSHGRVLNTAPRASMPVSMPAVVSCRLVRPADAPKMVEPVRNLAGRDARVGEEVVHVDVAVVTFESANVDAQSPPRQEGTETRCRTKAETGADDPRSDIVLDDRLEPLAPIGGALVVHELGRLAERATGRDAFADLDLQPTEDGVG